MRNKNNKHLGIEVDPELHQKLHYIARYEGRSGNGQPNELPGYQAEIELLRGLEK